MFLQKFLLKVKTSAKRRPFVAVKTFFMYAAIFLIFIFSGYFIYLRVFPQTKNILVLTTNATYSNTFNTIHNSRFRNAHFLNIDSFLTTNESFLYNTTIQMIDNHPQDLKELLVGHQFVLIGSATRLVIPNSLPVLPKKRQVIGYTLNTCTSAEAVLFLPNKFEGSLLTIESFYEFISFNNQVLKGQYTDDEAFRIFTDFFSRRLLSLSCNFAGHLPPWEEIKAVDEENRPPISKPWGDYQKIPEVWKVTKELL